MADRQPLPSFWRLAVRYLPAIALVLAGAIVVWQLPSTNAAQAGNGDGVSASSGGPSTGVSVGPAGQSGVVAPGAATGSGVSSAVANGANGGATNAAAGAPAPQSASCHLPSYVFVDTYPGQPCSPKGLDCSRNQVSKSPTCRPPAYVGARPKNGVTGVTASTITIVYYNPKQNAQVQAILSAAGTATEQNRAVAMQGIASWINKHFELYGRHIKVLDWTGTSAANDDAGQQQDAISVANMHPFAVMSEYAGPTFYDELHRRHVLAFTWYQFAADYFAKHSPDLFGLFQDRDTTLDYEAEYICKKLNGGNAVFAGDPTMHTKKRVFGIAAQQGFGNDVYLANKLQAECGIPKSSIKMIEYPADISQAATIATNAVVQMKQAGVTTVTCICDVIAPIYFTEQATNQGWYPEWIQNGFYVTDANAAGRLYDQTQWSHSFGTSTLAFPQLLAQTPGFRVCVAGGGDKHDCRMGQTATYAPLAILATAFEQLGPNNVTDDNVARMLLSSPGQGGATGNDPHMSFGSSGPGPYTFLDDTMEIWWSASRTGNDGKTGTAFYVKSGQRLELGRIPAGTPKVFADDGSPQPPQDPDAND